MPTGEEHQLGFQKATIAPGTDDSPEGVRLGCASSAFSHQSKFSPFSESHTQLRAQRSNDTLKRNSQHQTIAKALKKHVYCNKSFQVMIIIGKGNTCACTHMQLVSFHLVHILFLFFFSFTPITFLLLFFAKKPKISASLNILFLTFQRISEDHKKEKPLFSYNFCYFFPLCFMQT